MTTTFRAGHEHAAGPFSQRILDIGFITALLLAGLCLVLSATYLYSFLLGTNSSVRQLLEKLAAAQAGSSSSAIDVAVQAETVMARLTLLSCGVFVAMSFGFLGFSLFLIGIKGEMDLNASAEKYSVKIARMSPGIFVILCAVVLIGVCVTHRVNFRLERGISSQGPKAPQSPPETLGDTDLEDPTATEEATKEDKKAPPVKPPPMPLSRTGRLPIRLSVVASHYYREKALSTVSDESWTEDHGGLDTYVGS